MPPDERLGQIAIEDEMRSSYLSYAMSVIVGRALPDVRDGLKPVHRRILHGMNEMGLASNRAYRKSAKIVGEIMGNYHPHGDSAIYDTLVRMAQPFNMRYMLVDGQGNYGSVDGDPPAAMRYTEARLTKVAEDMLADIDKETVDFGPNYDESLVEPLELPYQVNKSKLIEKIAELIRDERIKGISDLRDESDREGIRVVIELRRGEIPLITLNNLYKLTQLQTTFGVIMLALVNNRPEVLNLKQILHHFIEHRREVVVRRTAFELRKAEERAHILEGLKIALDNLDAVITLIRRAQSPDEARVGLMRQFTLSEIQANAILEMRLQRLTQLERNKLIEEYKDVLKQIERLKSILGSDALVRTIVKDELIEVREAYKDYSCTKIVKEEAKLTLEDMITIE